MRHYRVSIIEIDDEGQAFPIFSQNITHQYLLENPQVFQKIIAVINCLPFPLFNITEPKEK